MKKLLISLFVIFTITLPMVAFAQDAGPVEMPGEVIEISQVPAIDDNPAGFFSFLLEKVQKGEWWPVFGLALMVVTFLTREYLLKWLATKWKWLEWTQTKWGGKLVLFSLSVLGAVGTAIGTGMGLSSGLLLTALGVAWAASGGWEDVKDVVRSLLERKEAKAEPVEEEE